MPEREPDQHEQDRKDPPVSAETLEDLEVAEPDADDVRGGVGSTVAVMKARCPLES